MKLLRKDGNEFEFEFALEEKGMLFHLLGMYPAVPATHHQLTKSKKMANRKENQDLLDEAIRSQRKANQKEIIVLMGKPGRFADGETFSRVVFKRDELEWLLQVLNDVRVGCWLALGSPDTPQERRVWRDKKSLRHLMLMEIAGSFEMFILGAVNGDLKPGADNS